MLTVAINTPTSAYAHLFEPTQSRMTYCDKTPAYILPKLHPSISQHALEAKGSYKYRLRQHRNPLVHA